MSVTSDNYDLIVLEILTKEDDYGYNIVKKITSFFTIEVKEVSIYTVVKRLEKNEMITSYIGDIAHGNKRKYYKITELGRRFLEEKRIETIRDSNELVNFLGGFNEKY